jgi:hypothetical protein
LRPDRIGLASQSVERSLLSRKVTDLSDDSVTASRTRATIDRYIELTRMWDSEALLALWAEDGVLRLAPASLGEFAGWDALASHYRSRPTERPFEFEVASIHVDTNSAVVVVTGQDKATGANFEVADIFTIDAAGRIKAVVGYYR